MWCVTPVNITPEYYLAGLLWEGVVKLERKSEGSEQVTRAKGAIICLVLDRGAQIEKYSQRTVLCPYLDSVCLLTHTTETVNLWAWHARALSRHFRFLRARSLAVLLSSSASWQSDWFQLPVGQPCVQKRAGCKGLSCTCESPARAMGLNDLVGGASRALITA